MVDGRIVQGGSELAALGVCEDARSGCREASEEAQQEMEASLGLVSGCVALRNAQHRARGLTQAGKDIPEERLLLLLPGEVLPLGAMEKSRAGEARSRRLGL